MRQVISPSQDAEVARSRVIPSAKNWSRPPPTATPKDNTSSPPPLTRATPSEQALNKWKRPDTLGKSLPSANQAGPSTPSPRRTDVSLSYTHSDRQYRPSGPAQGHSHSERSSRTSQSAAPQQKPATRAGEPRNLTAENARVRKPATPQLGTSQNIPRRQEHLRPTTQRHQNAHPSNTHVVTNKPTAKGPAKSRKSRPKRDVYIPTTLTVSMLAKLLKVKLDHLLNKMHRVGMADEASYDYILTSDYAVLLAEELGFNPIIDDEAAFDLHPPPVPTDASKLLPRPPIVTIMGHVDHGKTTLLDTLRSTSVAKGEAGGITQHIGAFSVLVANQGSKNPQEQKSITFLDTPGHAAFSAMRARGAQVTDIVVLVVAADDGIMPQTKEVINLLKDEARIGLVVAINKVDKPDADPDTVKTALMAEGIQLEDLGGDIPSVHVSGLTGEGLPELVETISAVAEMQDLRAEQEGPVYGHVIESNFHKGLGPVATVLVRSGCLKNGTQVICGLAQGKVRRMTDSNGKVVQKALPSMAVTVSGWKTLPKAGDEVLEGSDSDIKKALANRIRAAEQQALQGDIEAINTTRKQERDARAEGVETLPQTSSGPKELRLMIKADVSGSAEALEGALQGIGNKIAVSKVISTNVGDITESDVMIAKAANATILGFSVSVSRSVQNVAAQNGVPIFTSNIIYRIIEDVRSRVIALLPVIVETKVVGEATVLQVFEIQLKSKQVMKVAGSRVTNGIIEKQKFARLVRDGEIIHEGMLETMRQIKKDITEARKGMECGLSFKDFSDLREGDLIQMYEKIEKPGVL
ncbi:hypothetical protein D9613_002934 [Agrocybe pediades]|uniref:Translation initiation factor IF-2, mitochondrial n=1 Tax=Agrocybe pediades TaxID=84607 RepID=A0A8H4QQI6_9AGAR|nr:hypothetical protein D9613_002934 [Agrocybe pediades]